MTDSARRVAVVVGSTRPARICLEIATWARDSLPADTAVVYELLDLADVDLPHLDEPLQASLHRYAHEHTIRWSEVVAGFDGFVFVFPQYNWGYPGVLKNALDYLYDEWRDKPATVITYGTHGGNRGAEQLSMVLKGLHMRPLDGQVHAAITSLDIDAEWQLRDVDATLRPHLPTLVEIGREMRHSLEQTAPSREGVAD